MSPDLVRALAVLGRADAFPAWLVSGWALGVLEKHIVASYCIENGVSAGGFVGHPLEVLETPPRRVPTAAAFQKAARPSSPRNIVRWDARRPRERPRERRARTVAVRSAARDGPSRPDDDPPLDRDRRRPAP